MQKIYFLDGKAFTKTQVIHEVEVKSIKTNSKNKRRLREGLIFRPVKNYKTWGEFIGGCEHVGYNSVPKINIKSIIHKALESRGITEPCIAVFRLNGQSFVYSERGKPVIYNARLIVERGGTWYKEKDRDGIITDWYLGDRDAARIFENEYLLTQKIEFPSDMSDEWQKICLDRYGQVCDKYHIVPPPQRRRNI